MIAPDPNRDTGRLPALLWLVPCAIALVYLGVFVARFSHNIWTVGWSSDYASGFTLPETLVRTGTGGHTVLGTTALYVPLWFGLLTARLPLHRQLWEIAPTLLLIVAALTIGWSVAQIASRRAAALAVLMVLIASPWALSVFMAPVAHNTVYPGTALLGAYLIWLTRSDGRRRATALAVPPLAAAALGACVASDVLLVPTGDMPFALTALLAGLRRDRRSRRLALSALATVVGAVPIARLTSTVMSSLGYRTNAPSLEVALFSSLSIHAQLLLDGFKRLFNGYLGTAAPGTLHAELGVACDIVVAAALLTLLVAGARSAAYFVLSRRRAAASTQTQLAMNVHIVYWVGSALLACGAFFLTTFLDSPHEAFYATVIFSVAAVVPLFVGSHYAARWLAPVGASILFVASLVGLTSYYIVPVIPLARYEADIVKYARANHATAGYAGYWEASSLTWNSHERVAVRPVFSCPNPEGEDICVFSQETVPSWYVPKRRNTFLLVDAGEAFVRSLPEGLGPPLAAYAFGPVKMFIYPYDIAAGLGPSTG